MSSILRKVDQAIHPEQRQYAAGPVPGQHAGTAGIPRGATTTAGGMGAHHGMHADQAYASNNQAYANNNQTYANNNNYTTGSSHYQGNQATAYGRNLPGPAPNTAGPHRSDLLNKLDPRVDSDMSNPQTRAAHTAAMGQLPGPAPSTAGPHRSDLLNKLDPTVDSNLSTGRGAGTGGLRTGGMGAGQYNPGAGVATAGGAHGPGAPEGTYGPHKSRIANALDPRVDSDADGSYGQAASTSHHQPAYMSGGATMSGNNNIPEGTYGPHNSRLANTLDPRVDSDADSRFYNAAGAGNYQQPGHHQQPYGIGGHAVHNQQAYGGGAYTGQHAAREGTYGPHRSRIANAMDPRVDSDMDRHGGTTGFAGQPGATGYPNQATTATNLGPHRSSLLNKLDPKVDSRTGQVKPPKHI